MRGCVLPSSLLRSVALGIALSGLAAGLAAPAARAQTSTASGVLTVSATVLKFCTVGSSLLAFGNYTPSTASTASTNVLVTCTAGTPYSIAMSLDAGDTTAARKMAGPVLSGTESSLLYALYRDSARAQPWGETTGTDTLSGTGTGLPVSVPVYGAIASGQSPAPGIYGDVVAITLTY